MLPDDPTRGAPLPPPPVSGVPMAYPPPAPPDYRAMAPPAAPALPPPTAPRVRRRWGRIVTVVLLAVLAAGATATAIGYAVVTRRDAQHNFTAAQAWRVQAEARQETIDEQLDALVVLQAELAGLRNEIAALEAARDSATAEADGLQALLDDANRRLGEAEARVAALAGVQARAADQAIVSGGR